MSRWRRQQRRRARRSREEQRRLNRFSAVCAATDRAVDDFCERLQRERFRPMRVAVLFGLLALEARGEQ